MSDTGPAKLPGLPVLKTSDAALNRWAQAVAEHLEVRNGARGNAAEKTVVQRDLTDLNTAMAYLKEPKRTAEAGDTIIDLGGGMTASISTEKLVAALLESAKFKSAIATTGTTGTATSTTMMVTDDSALNRLGGEVKSSVAALESNVAALKTLATDTAVAVRSISTASGITRGPVSLNGTWDRSRWPQFATAASWLVWVEFGGSSARTNFADSSHLVIGDTVALEDVRDTRVVSNTTAQWRGTSKGWADVVKMDSQLSSGTKISNYLFNLNDLIEFIFHRLEEGTKPAKLNFETVMNAGVDAKPYKFSDFFSAVRQLRIEHDLLTGRIYEGKTPAKLHFKTVMNAGVGADDYTFSDFFSAVQTLREEHDALRDRVAALEARP